MPIESGMLHPLRSRSTEKVETYYYDIRKQVFEYDEVDNNQDGGRDMRTPRVLLEGRELKAAGDGYGERTMDDVVQAYSTPSDRPRQEVESGPAGSSKGA